LVTVPEKKIYIYIYCYGEFCSYHGTNDINVSVTISAKKTVLRNQLTVLCFHLFVLIQTCTYLYSSKYSPQWGK